MTATLIGALFGLAVVAAGAGPARRLFPQDRPLALGAVVGLAATVVLSANVAAAWRVEPAVVVLAWAILVASRLGRRGGPGCPEGCAVDSPSAGVLAITALVLAAPILVLPVPLDTDAQGFGMLALAMRDGGTIDTLAPWRPGIAYLYAPGALLLFAAVSTLSPGASMSAVMMGVTHAGALLFVWLAWELGRELARHGVPAPDASPTDGTSEGDAWPGVLLVSAASSVGLWTALLDAHYTAVFGLLFILAVVTALARFLRTGRGANLVAATVAMSAVAVTHADSTMILALGLPAVLFLGWLGRGGPGPRRWLMAGLVPPLGAALLAGPWLASLVPLLQTSLRSPYGVSAAHWRVLVILHGVIWPVLALLGATVWIRRGRWWAIVMAGWLATVVDASTLGWSARALPVVERLLRFNYPFSVAWHGPVIPYMILGGAALVWLLPRAGLRHLPAPGWRGVALVGGMIALGVTLAEPIRALSHRFLAVHGAFASTNDLRAMHWLRDHTAPDGRILNYPGDYEGRREWEAHWAPVETERDCVYFRMQLFFLERPGLVTGGTGRAGGLAAAYAEQRALLSFWRDPADPAHGVGLRRAGIGYVLVPESIGDPGSVARAWRWQPPSVLSGVRSMPVDAAYLRLVYRAGGAQVFQVAAAGVSAPGARSP